MRSKLDRRSFASASRNALLGLLGLLAAASVLYACGGGGGDMKGAAGSGPLPTIGAPCTTDCMTGWVCERAGFYAGQCTASCGSGAACQLLAPNTACFGTGPAAQCGVLCTSSAECPTGTTCQPVAGMMGCLRSATPTP